MSTTNKTIVAILVLAGLIAAFWMLILSPKREEVTKLDGQIDQLSASLAETERQVAEAELAKREFPDDYRRLVVLGQAVPSSEETASLLVEVNRIARRAKVRFEGIELEGSGGGEAAAEVPAAPPASSGAGVPAAETVAPTEAAAALMPLGSTIGPAGLGVMPYKLSFTGSFFRIADFIEGIDSLVGGSGEDVDVAGRLVTLDGFSLSESDELKFPYLEASFSVTTYLTPPSGAAAGTTAAGSTLPAPTEPIEPAESTEPAAPADESTAAVAEAR